MLVHSILENSSGKFPDKIALIHGKDRFTYHQINASAAQLANALMQNGIKKQDRVAIFMDNGPEAVISIFGILKAGGIFVFLNPLIKLNKFKYIMKDASVRFLIVDKKYCSMVQESADELPELVKIIWCTMDRSRENDSPFPLEMDALHWSSIVRPEIAPPTCIESPEIMDIDLAALIYTSGSTGYPKGVMSAHYNILAAVQSITQYLHNKESDVILNVLPLSFDYGLYQVLMAFFIGATVILEKSFAFPYQAFKLIQEEAVTGFPIVPTISALLINMKEPPKFDLSSVRYITSTGSVFPQKHIYKLREIFPSADIYSMFGLTECKRVSYLPPEFLDSKPHSVGIPMPSVNVFIVDDKGDKIPADVVGELVISGPNVMQGYWNDPEATAKTFRADNNGKTLLYSGDLFRKDADGFLYFIARKDDLIKIKGERVSPKEIENILCELYGVAEAAVIGVPDDTLGQAIKAFIVPDKNTVLSDKQIKMHCSKHLEPYAVPKYIEFLDSFPKTENGKIDKKQLK